MGQSFSRSLRSLETDRFRPSLVVTATVIALIVLWALWCTLARVDLWEVSESARIETTEAAFRIEAPAAGRIVQVALEVGQTVAPGDRLLVLETGQEVRRHEQLLTLSDTLHTRLAILESEREAVTAATEASLDADQAALAEARSRLKQAAAAERLADRQLERMRTLHGEGVVASEAADSALASRDEAAAHRAALADRVARLTSQRAANANEGAARLARIADEIAELRSQIDDAASELDQLDLAVAERVVRAPVAGRLGHVELLRPGSYVEEGDPIAALIPDGAQRVVGRFPVHTLGRIRPGQQARLRLDAFPWLQYGELAAEVLAVGNEPANGTVQVVLDLKEPGELPLQHGLTGSVAVLVERAAPIELLLRAVGTGVEGRAIDRPAAT
jgi:membrane fusion protein (multidrug efflux system)